MIKVCIVGIGGISGAHIPNWKDLKDEVEIVGICDIRPERTALYPEYRAYTSCDEMLDREKPDILDICLPTFLHVEYALKAINRKINVLCEKPISLHRDEVKTVYDAAKRNGVNFMVAHVLRFWHAYEYLKKVYDEGTFGKLLSGNMRRLGRIPTTSWNDWMKDYEKSGAVPYDLHIHDLDFLVWMLGKPTSSDCGRTICPEQDSLGVLYRFGDVYVTCESSWYAADYPFCMSYRFQFEKAIVSFEKDKVTVYGLTESFEPDLSGLEGGDNAYKNEIEYFVKCYKGKAFPDRVKPQELETVIETLNSL